MIEDWLSNRVRELEAFRGKVIERVMIREMAFLGGEGFGEPVFEHADCPFKQALSLYLWFDDSSLFSIHAYQNDCEFGLRCSFIELESRIFWDEGNDSIFRMSEFPEFPTGNVGLVSVTQNENLDISEVSLIVNGIEVLLVAGEVYETNDGSLSIKRYDESVLVFLDPADLEKVTFDNY